MAAIQADDAVLLQEGESAKLSEEAYRRAVLRSPPQVSEQDLDAQLKQEARLLGLQIERISTVSSVSSPSTSITAFDTPEESLTQQSTAPASTPASESRQSLRPVAADAPVPGPLRRATTTSYLSDAAARPSSLLRGLSKIATLRRRRSDKSKSIHDAQRARQPSRLVERVEGMRSAESCFTTQTRNDSWSKQVPAASTPAKQEKPLIHRPELHRRVTSTDSVNHRPGSARPQTANECHESCFDAQTKICSWSMSLTLYPTPAEETGGPVELDATQSPPENPEFQELQSQQLAERGRFIEYQRKCLKNLRQGLEESKKRRQEAHVAFVEERKAKVSPCLLVVTYFQD